MVQKSQTITRKEWDQRPTSTGEFTGFLNHQQYETASHQTTVVVSFKGYTPLASNLRHEVPDTKSVAVWTLRLWFLLVAQKKMTRTNLEARNLRSWEVCFIGFSFAKGNVPMTTFDQMEFILDLPL